MRKLIAVTCTFLVSVMLAACGSGGSSSSTQTAGAAPTGSASSSSTTPTASSASFPGIATTLAYVKGKAGKADPAKSPVTVGFVTTQGGVPSFPEDSVTAKAAVEYINDKLGGIDGHPLKFDYCNITSTEEQAQNCAEQFVNSSVPMVASGQLDIGNATFLQTLDGKVPFVAGSAGGVADATAKNTILLVSGVLELPTDIAEYVQKYYHPKTASVIAPSSALTSLAVAGQKAALEKLGITTSTSLFPAASTNLIAPLTAANAKNADVLIAYAFTPNCPAVARTLTELGRTKPTIALGLCIDPTVKQALGGDYPKWNIVFNVQNPFFPQNSPDVAAYVAAMHHYAGPNANVAGQAGNTYLGVLTVARILNEVGAANLSRATVTKALKNYSGPGFMTAPEKCGSIASLPALCNAANYVNVYDGNGKWSDLTHNQGITPGG